MSNLGILNKLVNMKYNREVSVGDAVAGSGPQ